MTVEAQGPGDLEAWALSKTCVGWRKDRSCGHAGCAQAQRATEMLRELKRVEGALTKPTFDSQPRLVKERNPWKAKKADCSSSR